MSQFFLVGLQRLHLFNLEGVIMNFKVPRGTQDILPSETWKWQKVEEAYWRSM